MPQNLAPHQLAWLAALDEYARRFPTETATITEFGALMRSRADAAERARADAHLTGSAWLVDAPGRRVLLTHHRKLDRWLQLGGHADGETELAAVALREAEEESGLRGLVVESAIFDLDRHRIPARGAEAAHDHYDVRFVVHARQGDAFVVGEESHALAWREIDALAADATADESLVRMARKWLARTRS